MFFGLYDPATKTFRALLDQREKAESFPGRKDEEVAGRVLFKVRINPVPNDYPHGFWAHWNPDINHFYALFNSKKDAEEYPLAPGSLLVKGQFAVELVHESEDRFPSLQTVISRKHYENPL